MKKAALLAATFAGLSVFATAGYAQDCKAVTVEDAFDLDEVAIVALYDCLKDAMAEGYAKEGDPIGKNYRNWIVTSTRPAVQGAHSNRLLQTFANPVAAEHYLKFEEEGVVMPVGSVLAKESITVSIKKTAAGRKTRNLSGNNLWDEAALGSLMLSCFMVCHPNRSR